VSSPEYYETFRFLHGVPAFPHELHPEKTLPLESNLDRLNGISYDKGQELVARSHFQGQIRKRIVPFYVPPATLEQLPPSLSPLPRLSNFALEDHGLLSYSFLRTYSSPTDASSSLTPGSDILLDGKSVGKILSVDAHSNLGLALLRIEELPTDGSSKHDYQIQGFSSSAHSSDTTAPISKYLTAESGQRVHPYIPLWWN